MLEPAGATACINLYNLLGFFLNEIGSPEAESKRVQASQTHERPTLKPNQSQDEHLWAINRAARTDCWSSSTPQHVSLKLVLDLWCNEFLEALFTWV
jgi:hypothetical protein